MVRCCAPIWPPGPKRHASRRYPVNERATGRSLWASCSYPDLHCRCCWAPAPRWPNRLPARAQDGREQAGRERDRPVRRQHQQRLADRRVGVAASLKWAPGTERVEIDEVDPIEAVCEALADHADAVRRRFWRDPEFRSICEDYRDATLVISALRAGPCADPARAAEYRQLAAELLAEVAEMLRGERSCTNPSRKSGR